MSTPTSEAKDGRKRIHYHSCPRCGSPRRVRTDGRMAVHSLESRDFGKRGSRCPGSESVVPPEGLS